MPKLIESVYYQAKQVTFYIVKDDICFYRFCETLQVKPCYTIKEKAIINKWIINMDNDQLLQQASQFAENGQFDRARKLVMRAIKNDGMDIEAWWALANVASDKKERSFALDKVLGRDPTHMHALHMRDQMKAGTLDSGAYTDKVGYDVPKDIDFMPKVAITLVAYFVLYFVGLLLNIYFLYDANQFQNKHGFKPENIGCLWAMLAVFVIAPFVMCFGVFGITTLISISTGY